jgi:hypothetical protein
MWTVRTIWPGANPTPQVSTNTTRKEEGKKTMARRKLTLKEQLKGVRAALKSKRTPPQFREGLRKRAAWLGKRIGGT